MSEHKKTDEFDIHKKRKNHDNIGEISRVDERRFSQSMQELMQDAEDLRMKHMQAHRARGFIAMNFSILAATIGAIGFGWFFLMKLDIVQALFCAVVPIILSAIVYYWAGLPIKTYKSEHKSVFMPKLAKALSGLSYHQDRGINAKILERTGVLPPHNRIHSEDCFMGTYKGSKVVFSEARLYQSAKPHDPVFQGIFVLLETPQDVFEGHTIITANSKLAETNIKKRWKSMTQLAVTPTNPDWDIFTVFSTKPEAAELIVGDKLLKELAEASAIFKNAALTSVLFGKRYVFIMIPHDDDMFEASDLYVPVSTRQHAETCKKEIEQLLEIVDIFDLYKPLHT